MCSFIIITINRSIPILGCKGPMTNNHHDDDDCDANDRGRRGRGHDVPNGHGHDSPNDHDHDMVQRSMLLL